MFNSFDIADPDESIPVPIELIPVCIFTYFVVLEYGSEDGEYWAHLFQYLTLLKKLKVDVCIKWWEFDFLVVEKYSFLSSEDRKESLLMIHEEAMRHCDWKRLEELTRSKAAKANNQ